MSKVIYFDMICFIMGRSMDDNSLSIRVIHDIKEEYKYGDIVKIKEDMVLGVDRNNKIVHTTKRTLLCVRSDSFDYGFMLNYPDNGGQTLGEFIL